MKSYMTKDTAIKYAKALFSRAKDGTVTREDALAGAGRAVDDSKWLSYILTALREYELFTKKFADGKITHLVLTANGREALGLSGPDEADQNEQPRIIDPGDGKRVLTPESVNADVKELAKLNPSFEVRLVFHPKGESID